MNKGFTVVIVDVDADDRDILKEAFNVNYAEGDVVLMENSEALIGHQQGHLPCQL